MWRRVEMKCLILLLFGLASLISCEEENLARLLISKQILNKYVVEGKDLVTEYQIYNVGGSAALNVQLIDNSFAEEDFQIVQGMLKVKWDRIAPNTNVSHTVVLRPKKAGMFNFTSAEVSYKPSENEAVQSAYTSAPGEGVIINYREFDRKFSPHVLDWTAFAVMTLPSLGIPFMLWYKSKKKYDAFAKPPKKHH